MFNLFQKKEEKKGLHKALETGLITKEEFLRLMAQRAADDLTEFLSRQKGPKPKKSDLPK